MWLVVVVGFNCLLLLPSHISQQIPDQPWFLWSCFTITVGGILPYGAVFIEMFFILQSLWMGNYYYVFGFLMLVFIILIITCADIAMVFCYFQLCAEDYNWSVSSISRPRLLPSAFAFEVVAKTSSSRVSVKGSAMRSVKSSRPVLRVVFPPSCQANPPVSVSVLHARRRTPSG